MHKEEIINTQLSLRADNYDKNKKDIDKLSKLYQKVVIYSKKWVDTANQNVADEANAKANVESSIPSNENILTKESNMEAKPDLDMNTDDTGKNGWNRGTNYSQKNTDNVLTVDDNKSV